MTKLEKWWNMPIYIHFLMWFVFSITLFFLVFYYFATPKIPFERLCWGSLLIGTFISLMPTMLMHLAKKSKVYYDGLRELEGRANLTTTKEGLQAIREQIVNYYKKKSFHSETARATKEVMIKIDTRLKYEFKEEV